MSLPGIAEGYACVSILNLYAIQIDKSVVLIGLVSPHDHVKFSVRINFSSHLINCGAQVFLRRGVVISDC